MTGLAAVDVAILAGGLGTRVRDVLKDVPKILAPVGGRTLVDHLVARLAAFGAGRVVFCLGFLADKVVAHLSRMDGVPGVSVEWVIEDRPLGTAGALRLAAPLLRADHVLVMNGDTWLDADLGAFLEDHRRRQGAVSILCVHVDDMSRYGRVELDGAGRVVRFAEKDPADRGPGLINGGVYLFSRAGRALLEASEGPSLERDFLARLAPGEILGFAAPEAAFIDIGTPESLALAATVIDRTAKPDTTPD